MAAETRHEVITPDQLPGTDGDITVRAHFDAMTVAYLRRVVTDEVIEEHRQNPVGHQSEALGRLLIFLRRLPIDRQYALKQDPDGTWRLMRMTGRPGHPPVDTGEAGYRTQEEGRHAIFLRQIKDVMEQ